MSILLVILYTLGAIILLFLLLALFIKNDFKLEKQVMIKKSQQDVFNYCKLLKNQEYYSVWVMKDPNIQIVYTGIDGTVGACSSWTSNDKNVGIGAQEIIKLDEGNSMQVEIRFEKPFKATNYATNTLTTIGNGETKLSHVFTGHSKFPMNLMNLFMDKLVGKDMQQNLENMKAILEK